MCVRSWDVSALVLGGDASASHTLVVGVWDPNDEGLQPHGKQKCGTMDHAFGVAYTCTTGIWGSVWLERLASRAALPPDALSLTPTEALDGVEVEVEAGVKVALAAQGAVSLRFAVLETGDVFELALAELPTAVKVAEGSPQLWSPDQPHLYKVNGTLLDAKGVELDSFRTYFGVRRLAVLLDADGVPRPALNGQPIFQFGVLDQGFWPDGIYTPPSDEAIASDAGANKRLLGDFLSHSM